MLSSSMNSVSKISLLSQNTVAIIFWFLRIFWLVLLMTVHPLSLGPHIHEIYPCLILSQNSVEVVIRLYVIMFKELEDHGQSSISANISQIFWYPHYTQLVKTQLLCNNCIKVVFRFIGNSSESPKIAKWCLPHTVYSTFRMSSTVIIECHHFPSSSCTFMHSSHILYWNRSKLMFLCICKLEICVFCWYQ